MHRGARPAYGCISSRAIKGQVAMLYSNTTLKKIRGRARPKIPVCSLSLLYFPVLPCPHQRRDLLRGPRRASLFMKRRLKSRGDTLLPYNEKFEDCFSIDSPYKSSTSSLSSSLHHCNAHNIYIFIQSTRSIRRNNHIISRR